MLSSSVKSPISGLAISNGLRPGLAMVAKTLADELGPNGTRVNGLMPGRIATDRLKELDGKGGDPEAARRASEKTIPLRRYGDPDEFGRVAAFILSPAASYITGTIIPIDGGALRTIWPSAPLAGHVVAGRLLGDDVEAVPGVHDRDGARSARQAAPRCSAWPRSPTPRR